MHEGFACEAMLLELRHVSVPRVNGMCICVVLTCDGVLGRPRTTETKEGNAKLSTPSTMPSIENLFQMATHMMAEGAWDHPSQAPHPCSRTRPVPKTKLHERSTMNSTPLIYMSYPL
jgi:hypothetical protein